MITDQEVEEYNALAVSLFKKYETYRGNNKEPFENVIFGAAALISNLGVIPIGDDKKKMIDITSKLNASNMSAITTVICDFRLGQLNKDIKPHVFHARLNENKKGKIIQTANEWAHRKSNGLIHDLLTDSDFENLGKILIKTKSKFKGDWKRPFEIWNNSPDSQKMLEFNGNKIRFMKSSDSDVSLSDFEVNTLIVKIPYLSKEGSMIIYMPKYNAEREDFIKFLKKLEVTGEFNKFLKSFGQYIKADVEMPEFSIDCDTVDLTHFLEKAIEKIFYSEIFENKIDFDKVYHRIKSSIRCTPYGTESESTVWAWYTDGVRRTPLFKINKPFLFFVVDGSNCIVDAGMFVNRSK